MNRDCRGLNKSVTLGLRGIPAPGAAIISAGCRFL